MASKTSKPKQLQRPESDRVWIELDRPVDVAHAEAICAKANRMLKRLMPGTSMHFWVSTRHGSPTYNLTTSEAGTYTELADRGHWFNLDYLGREGE